MTVTAVLRLPLPPPRYQRHSLSKARARHLSALAEKGRDHQIRCGWRYPNGSAPNFSLRRCRRVYSAAIGKEAPMEIRQALTFDDVMLVPAISEIMPGETDTRR